MIKLNKNKIQNIYNQLSSLLIQLRNINVTKLSFLPYRINTMSIGENKLSSCLGCSISEITKNDLLNVMIIGNHSFTNCQNLTNVEIPDSVTEIGDYAFYNCISLTSVTIPDSVTTIGFHAFSGCSSLSSVKIPNGVTTIDGYVFTRCNLMTDIYLYPITPPALGTDAIPSSATIHVPIGSGDAYKSATNWSSYASNIVEDIEI